TAARLRLTVPADAPPRHYTVGFRLYDTLTGLETPAVWLEAVWMGAPGLPRAADAATCIREAFVARPAEVHVHLLDVKVAAGMRYAYVRGADEGILDTLKLFPLDVHVMTDDDLNYLDLAQFDAVVVGPNA